MDCGPAAGSCAKAWLEQDRRNATLQNQCRKITYCFSAALLFT